MYHTVDFQEYYWGFSIIALDVRIGILSRTAVTGFLKTSLEKTDSTEKAAS